MMTISLRHFMLLGFENLKFCEAGYRLSALQVSNLVVVWIEFYGGWCKTPKNTIVTSFLITEFANKHIL